MTMIDLEKRKLGPLSVIPGMNRGRYPYCHSIYIEDAGVVIDPSSDRKRLEDIKAQKDIQMVWLSHWHEDHLMHLDLDKNERAYWGVELKEKFHFRPGNRRGCFATASASIWGIYRWKSSTPPATPPATWRFFSGNRKFYF
jgi:glyoxylase-like metal-dependent hydrolase (beta-lactamase superfamily II)